MILNSADPNSRSKEGEPNITWSLPPELLVPPDPKKPTPVKDQKQTSDPDVDQDYLEEIEDIIRGGGV